MRLSVGPILYLWEREAVFAFYREVCGLPVDIVYLGEVVCSKRRALRRPDWEQLAGELHAAGKEVVYSTLALIEAESELGVLGRTAAATDFDIEANDMAAVQLRDGRPFIAGPHLNVYNPVTLRRLVARGARRWVAPVELGLHALEQLLAERPPGLEVEAFAWGRLPLAFSARCFTARAHNRPKDDCGFVCGNDPDGRTVYTREGEPFLALNGIQTQSARVHNAIGSVGALAEAGVDVLRLSPQSPAAASFREVVMAFHQAIRDPAAPAAAIATHLPGGFCDGYLHGMPGMVQSDPAASGGGDSGSLTDPGAPLPRLAGTGE